MTTVVAMVKFQFKFQFSDKTQDNIQSKVIDIMKFITTDFMLLLDLGPLQLSARSSYKSLEALMMVCIFGMTNPRCTSIIALSSGVNIVYNIPREFDALYKFMVSLGRYPTCHFKAFTKEEAVMYLETRGVTLEDNLVYNLTRYNPWLLSNLPQSMDMKKTIGIIKLQMLKYIRNLLDSFHSESLKHWISSNLEETDKWLYKATNGVPLNESEQSTFYHSWVFVECICDLMVCDDTCTIVSNFPYVYELLLKELSILKKNRKVPNNPIINGFIFESEFLQGIEQIRLIETITYHRRFTFQVEYVCTLGSNEKLVSMEYGVLYHLRYKHPVVDAVGILKRTDKRKYHLVFIQVSMSKYYSHSSKIQDLYDESVDCIELKNTTDTCILDLYKSMALPSMAARKAFYIYISPLEIGYEKSSKLLTGGYVYPNLRIGVTPELSATHNLVTTITSQFS